MADNVAITAGTGTTVAADDIAGVMWQRVKIGHGADGSATDVSTASPIPAQIRTSAGTEVDFTSGTAGTPGGGVSSIQGVSGMVAVKVDGSAVTQPVSGTVTANLGSVAGREYETVAASQTAQALGATGATGDDIDGLLVIPATTSPGNVILLDNATSITVFAGGASSVSNLVPFYIPLGMRSVSGAWKVTTGANVSVIGIGNFT